MSDVARGHTAATLFEAGAPAALAAETELRAVYSGARVVGPAFTVRGIGGDNFALHRAVYAAPPGSVLVADLQGARHGHWGEVLAVAAQQRGLAGLVIDGGVRDVTELAAMGFPVFARHVTVVGTGKLHAGTFDVTVRVAGANVAPGDLIVGDADGVVVIPGAEVEQALDRADARVADEQRAFEALREGATTLELFNLPQAGTAEERA
jgi:4-hydroxy-4-methyl-2-oxoglutarate aldolase